MKQWGGQIQIGKQAGEGMRRHGVGEGMRRGEKNSFCCPLRLRTSMHPCVAVVGTENIAQLFLLADLLCKLCVMFLPTFKRRLRC